MRKASRDGLTRKRRQFEARPVHVDPEHVAGYVPFETAVLGAVEPDEERGTSAPALLDASAPLTPRDGTSEPFAAAAPTAALS